MSFSPERYKQVARACKILELLQDSRFGKTAGELRDEVMRYMGLASVSQKSIERDIKFWQGYGVPIESERTNNPDRRIIWKLDRTHVGLPSLEVSVLELLAFAAGRELLLPLAGTPYWEGVHTLWAKMRQCVPEALWEHFERLRPSLIVRGVVAKSYADKEGMLSALNRAIYQHRITKIAYQTLTADSAEERLIEPHGIVLFEGSLYIVAVDADPSSQQADSIDFKLFKLDRLTKASPQDKRFSPREDFDPDALFASSIGVFRSGKATRFVIRLTPPADRWATESPIHPSQEVVEHDDDGLTLEIPTAYQPEIIARVLSLAPHAEVLEPKECRDELAAIARRLIATYTPIAQQ